MARLNFVNQWLLLERAKVGQGMIAAVSHIALSCETADRISVPRV